MNPDTAAKLVSINHQFYQTLAKQFSATRQRLQPGVLQVLGAIPANACILDIGCGNGELARTLTRRGFSGSYTGIDFSQELLQEAQREPYQEGIFTFIQADLSAPTWEEALRPSDASPEKAFDFVLAFAVLHHLPGSELRQQVMRAVRGQISPQGSFIHSVWQFLNSPRLRERILPWETVGLTSDQVEAGDALLDWRGGGYGTRYVHHFNEAELSDVAEETGFTIRQSYLSDGENHRLGLYQWWAPAGTGRKA